MAVESPWLLADDPIDEPARRCLPPVSSGDERYYESAWIVAPLVASATLISPGRAWLATARQWVAEEGARPTIKAERERRRRMAPAEIMLEILSMDAIGTGTWKSTRISGSSPRRKTGEASSCRTPLPCTPSASSEIAASHSGSYGQFGMPVLTLLGPVAFVSCGNCASVALALAG